MNLKTGHQLAGGRYRVERVLGQGGFGITYLCEQTGLLRKVAIKEFFMREYCERDDDTASITLGSRGSRDMVDRFRQKFIKEARALAALNHKHIIRIIDVFEENNTAYYVMEYVGGGSLADKVKSGALPEAVALRYIRQIASALDFVHGKRMMHLDVKPANILLNENDETVLIDFGLAKQYDSAGSQTSTTPVGISHGYAPLEQYKQGGVGTFSPATDIYSLGATLYKLLTGVTPPEAGDVMNDGLPALPQHISAPVRAAIEAAMQPRRNERPKSIGEFLSLLEGNVKAESGKVKTESNDDGETVIGGSNQNGEKQRGGNVPKPPFNKLLAIISVVAVCIVAVLLGIKSCNDRKAAEKEEQERIYAELRAQEQADSIAAEQQRIEDFKRGIVNGHKFVDLGLPSGLLWATCNVGASKPEDYGGYYAWGETEEKEDYSWSTYKWCNGSDDTMTKYCTDSSYGTVDNKTVLDPQDDVAHVKWGGTWRMPTLAEQDELLDNCTRSWTTQNGVKGYKVTGPNGNSIFLPAAGDCYGTALDDYGGCNYWSSSSCDSEFAYTVDFYRTSDARWCGRYRYCGLSVRPVCTLGEEAQMETEYAVEQQRLVKEAAEKAEQQRIDAERKAKEEAERLAAEKKRKEEEERKRREAANNNLSTRSYTVNGVSFKMIAVEGGTFKMGATAEQQDPDSDEKPVHDVTLSNYCIGETEVTQALWQAVMGSNPSDFTGSNNPVERVSYNDCITFINKLNTLLSGQLPSGRKFRLPTEAEWEYAARGGKRSRGYQYSGSDNLGSVAWYDDNSGSKTHHVKQKQANELGLYDMSGNVLEWCNDWFGSYSSSSQTNPKGPSSGSDRMLRGGCWINSALGCRVARRGYTTPDSRYKTFGLRLAL